MSSDLSSPLSSPKAKKTVTRTKKAAAKPVKATKGDHPSWKDIIRVRSSTTTIIDVKLTSLSGMYCCSPRRRSSRCFSKHYQEGMPMEDVPNVKLTHLDSSLKIVMALSPPQQTSRT